MTAEAPAPPSSWTPGKLLAAATLAALCGLLGGAVIAIRRAKPKPVAVKARLYAPAINAFGKPLPVRFELHRCAAAAVGHLPRA